MHAETEIETVQHLNQILDGSNHKYIPRNDYREACELTLIMLSDEPERWREKDRWRVPGAISNARWMAKIIYAPKMMAFPNQMEGWDEDFVLKLRDRNIHVLCVHKILDASNHWQRCSVFDLALYKELLQLQEIFPRISDAALKKLQNHTWYLAPEVVVFSLCSRLTNDSEKPVIAQKLLE